MFLSNVIFFSEVRRPLAEGVVLASPCPQGMSSVEKNARPPLTPGPNNVCPMRGEIPFNNWHVSLDVIVSVYL